MLVPAKPLDEQARLKALHELNILDTPLDPAFERITRLTKRMMDVPMVAINLIDAERQWIKSEYGLNTCETDRDTSFCAHTILQDELFIIPDTLKDDRFADNPFVTGDPHLRFYAGYPVRSAEGYNVGSLCILDSKPRSMSEEDLEPLKDMAALIEQELSMHKHHEYESKMMQELDKAKRDKMIDALTRVWNREGIEVNFREHSTKAQKNKHALALTIIDIDNFKHINDTYGHNAGDQVLREVTKRIVASLDVNDVIGRWGGEEFLGIIAMQCDNPEDCVAVFDKARKNIAQDPVEFEDKLIPVTASFGITYTDNCKANLVDIVAKADHALYQAKNDGKNKCCLNI